MSAMFLGVNTVRNTAAPMNSIFINAVEAPAPILNTVLRFLIEPTELVDTEEPATELFDTFSRLFCDYNLTQNIGVYKCKYFPNFNTKTFKSRVYHIKESYLYRVKSHFRFDWNWIYV